MINVVFYLIISIRRTHSQPLPTAFLKRISSKKGKDKMMSKKAPSVTYDRDIFCLTKNFANNNGTVKIPRSSESMEYVCRNGLKGKIRLTSDMTEEEIMEEIKSVFKRPFGGDGDFPFDILQPSGGKLKSLVIPSLSSSYVWTASAVAGNSKSPIYIMAGADIQVDVSCYYYYGLCIYNIIPIIVI